MPKEMLPVVDKPLIQYAVEEAYAAGVREMIFVTGRHKRAIEDHFDRTFELEDALEKAGKARAARAGARGQARRHGVRLTCASRRRSASATPCCARRRLVGDEPFAVLLADDLMVGTPPVLAQMVEQFASARRLRSSRCRKCRGAHPALRHRRRRAGRRAADRHRADRREARAARSRRRASASPAATS